MASGGTTIRCAGCGCGAECECLSRDRLLADAARLVATAAAAPRQAGLRREFAAMAARFEQVKQEEGELQRARKFLKRTAGRGAVRLLEPLLREGRLDEVTAYVSDVYLRPVYAHDIEAVRAYVADRWLRPRVTRPRSTPARRRPSHGRKPKIRCRPNRRARSAAPARQEVR